MKISFPAKKKKTLRLKWIVGNEVHYSFLFVCSFPSQSRPMPRVAQIPTGRGRSPAAFASPFPGGPFPGGHPWPVQPLIMSPQRPSQLQSPQQFISGHLPTQIQMRPAVDHNSVARAPNMDKTRQRTGNSMNRSSSPEKPVLNPVAMPFVPLQVSSTQGCHGQGKVRGKNLFFSRSGKSQGILHQVREILNSSLKSVKSQGILFSGYHKL